jgi:hypothetical protein
MMEIVKAALCYILPTFPLGFVWHLGPLKARYRELGIYRENVSPPLGLASMIVQGAIFGWAYVAAIAPLAQGWPAKAAIYAALGGALSWSFTTLAWAAKARITAIGAFVTIETAFTVIQWLIVGLVTALILG